MSEIANDHQSWVSLLESDSRLKVVTVEIEDPVSLIPMLPDSEILLWLRRGEGLLGFGEALRVEFSGLNRFRDASTFWRNTAETANVENELTEPGTGLVAFGSFSFSSGSQTPSVLVVPRRLLGRKNGRAWLTTFELVPSVDEQLVAKNVQIAGEQLSEDGFKQAVSIALERIRDGQLEKVVLARDLVGEVSTDFDLADTVGSLSLGYPDCWTFAIDNFFGSSPETLVQVHSGAVSARVLAGSAARGVDANADMNASIELATSGKDQDEHEFAVQSVVASLRPHCVSVTASDTPFTIRLPNLWHLASDVLGELSDESSSLDLVEALHPTAAVAGSPTEAALALIEELEPFDRGRYAGPVGWIDAKGDGEWAIALRCAQLGESGSIRSIAGAGIVEGSIPEKELAETKLKFKPIADLLGDRLH